MTPSQTPVALDRLGQMLATHETGKRIIVALVGAPGSGKSTCAELLQHELTQRHGQTTQIVPMDGFHFDDAILAHLGRADRKGAPDTFDVGGLEMTLARVSDAYLATDIAVPVFDRQLELSRASARLIHRTTRILLVEGNYLLLKTAPWAQLGRYFDQSVMIRCDESTLRHRLLQRWDHFGFTPSQARQKVDGNDLFNARLVIRDSAPADFILDQP